MDVSKKADITVNKSLPIKAEIIRFINTQLDCNGDTNGSLCYFAEGGWTQPWDNNEVNTPETGWGNPYTFSLLNTTTGELLTTSGSAYIF